MTDHLVPIIVNGRTDDALERIRFGAGLDAAAADGRTPLIAAAEVGDLHVVEALLNAGVDPNAFAAPGSADRKRLKAYLPHVDTGEVESTEAVLREVAESSDAAPTLFGRNALQTACRYGHASVAETLLKAGADPNKADGLGWTPMRIAIRRADEAVARAIVETSSAVRKPVRIGGALLEDAFSQGVAFLHLVARGRLDKKARNLMLVYACAMVDIELVERLLAEGADPNAKSSIGHSCLAEAITSESLEIYEPADFQLDTGGPRSTQRRVELVHRLVGAGADVNANAFFDRPVITAAAVKDAPDLIHALIAAGADVNGKGVNGDPVLAYVLIKRHWDGARVLIEHGADVALALGYLEKEYPDLIDDEHRQFLRGQGYGDY